MTNSTELRYYASIKQNFFNIVRRPQIAPIPFYLVGFFLLDYFNAKSTGQTFFTNWYLPQGLNLAFLLLAGEIYAPFVFGALLLVNLFNYGLTFSFSTLAATLITSMSCTLASIILKKVFRLNLKTASMRDVRNFLLVAILVPIPTALLVVYILSFQIPMTTDQFLLNAHNITLGDSTGIIVMTPFLLICHQRWHSLSNWKVFRENLYRNLRLGLCTLLSFTLIAVVALFSFGLFYQSDYHTFYFNLFPLIFIAFLFRFKATTLIILFFNLLIILVQHAFPETAISPLTFELNLFMHSYAVAGLLLSIAAEERWRAFSVLQKRTEELNMIFSAVPAGISYKDTKNRYLRVNHAAANMMGVSAEEITNMPAEEIYPLDAELLYAKDQQVLQTGEAMTDVLYLTPAHRQPRWIQSHRVKVITPNNEPGVVVFTLDITDQVKAQKEVELRFKLEELLVSISARLMDTTAEVIDSQMNQAIREIGETIGVERCCIVQFSEDLQTFSVRSEWCAEGIAPLQQDFIDSPTDSIRWLADKILNQDLVVISSADEIPASETVYRPLFEKWMKSATIVPMHYRGRVFGFLVLAYTTKTELWTTRIDTILKITAELFATALHRIKVEAELLEKENFYRSFFTQNKSVILIVDAETLQIVEANESACEYYGYPMDTFVGMPLHLLAFDAPQQVKELADDLRANQKTQLTSLHRLANNELRSVEVFASHYELLGRKLFYLICHDITKQKEAEAEIARQLSNMKALHAIDRAISNIVDIHDALQVIVEQVVEQLDVDAADILVFDKQTMTLSCEAWTGFRCPTSARVSIPIGYSHAGELAAGRKQRLDIYNISKQDNIPSGWRKEGFETCIAVCLMAKGAVNGVLEVYTRRPFIPDEKWNHFLNLLAGQAAIAIDNSTMFTSLQQSHMELMMAYNSTLEGWAKALELRDHETEGHCRRVVDMTMRLAKEMGFYGEELVHIRHGALLHDIGKMGIPDSILHKPGKLNDEEWEIMKQHPVYAYNLLSSIPYLRQAINIPYAHHEKWDGTGYPRGLKGEEIPIAARIFAIVDVWDALLFDRPYRKAWSPQQVQDYLLEQSGTHFDPKVVEAFMRIWKD